MKKNIRKPFWRTNEYIDMNKCMKKNCKDISDKKWEEKRKAIQNALTKDQKIDLKEYTYQMFNAFDNGNTKKGLHYMEKREKILEERDRIMHNIDKSDSNIDIVSQESECILQNCKESFKKIISLEVKDAEKKIKQNEMEKAKNSNGNKLDDIFNNFKEIVNKMIQSDDNLTVDNIQQYYNYKSEFWLIYSKLNRIKYYKDENDKESFNTIKKKQNEEDFQQLKNSKNKSEIIDLFDMLFNLEIYYSMKNLVKIDDECRKIFFTNQVEKEDNLEKDIKSFKEYMKIYRESNDSKLLEYKIKEAKKKSNLSDEAKTILKDYSKNFIDEDKKMFECVLSHTKSINELSKIIKRCDELVKVMSDSLSSLDIDDKDKISLSLIENSVKEIKQKEKELKKESNEKKKMDIFVDIVMNFHVLDIEKKRMFFKYITSFNKRNKKNKGIKGIKEKKFNKKI